MIQPKPIRNTPERCALLDEFVRQLKEGEEDYWRWTDTDTGDDVIGPIFRTVSYDFEPSPEHPHYQIYCEWHSLVSTEAAKHSGAVLLATHSSGSSCFYDYSFNGRIPWFVDVKYEIITKVGINK